MENFFEVLIAVCSVAVTVLSALYIFRAAFVVIGFFTTRRFPKAKKNHRYAILIAARNEESVIPKLIDSIKKQDYPEELITSFVLAHNCTDNTASAARESGAICYEYENPDERTKGFALKRLLEEINRDYGCDFFDAYFVFDADNLLDPDYISRMNEAFDSGERVVTSFRASKNIYENWISFSYAVHWISTAVFESRARSVLNLATRIQGTGFMFASDIVKDGWKYTSLTEDRAFAADLVVMGQRISYCSAARFYDEQPSSLKVALRQRIRWAKGHLEAFGESGGKLLRNIFFGKGKFMSYDMFLVNFPESLFYFATGLLTFVGNIALLVIAKASPSNVLTALGAMLLSTALSYLSRIFIPVFALIAERKRTPRAKSVPNLLSFLILYPLFSTIGSISTLIALFTKVEWKPIPHTYAAGIDSMTPEAAEKDMIEK